MKTKQKLKIFLRRAGKGTRQHFSQQWDEFKADRQEDKKLKREMKAVERQALVNARIVEKARFIQAKEKIRTDFKIVQVENELRQRTRMSAEDRMQGYGDLAMISRGLPN